MSHGPAPPHRPAPGGFARDAKEQVRQATDIVDLIGGYLQLRRQGRNYVGLCPWHNDTRPSMQVNPERQTFKCWPCDIGGDVFSFVMRIEGLEFREALEMLAERAGITLQTTGVPRAAPGGPGDKKTLLAAAAWAEEQFAGCLRSDPQADPARAYLADRGVLPATIERFRLGFAPDKWDWLLGKSRSTNFSPAVLERIGLVRPRQQGDGHYDFYRGRVIFPIRDVRSRPIAFGGRVLPPRFNPGGAEGVGGKYINSPETPLFSKSNQLYALDLARDAIASEGKIVVTEGYTDVIMAHQHGVRNVVAVLGTALGEKHLPVVRRFTDSIVLVLDGDEAGQRRTNEVLELFVANQIDLRILGLPAGLDPCDFIASPKEGHAAGRGPEAFRRLVNRAPDALEHKLQTVTNGLVTANDTHAASRAVELLLVTLAKVSTGVGAATSQALVREQSLLGRLARRFQLPEEGLRQRLATLRRSATRDTGPTLPPAASESHGNAPPEAHEPEATTRLTGLTPLEVESLELLLEDATSARRVLETVSLDDLTSPVARRLHQACADCFAQRGVIDLHWLMDNGDERAKSLLVEIDEARQDKAGSDLTKRVDDLAAAVARRRDEAHRRGALAALREGRLDNHQEEVTLSEFFAKLKDRQAGPLSTDG
ncbi:MAG: DNA primase [Planctomycetota bacterium]